MQITQRKLQSRFRWLQTQLSVKFKLAIEYHQQEIKRRLRVAAYCRVSTNEDAQASSYELQLQHYKENICNNPDWELVDIYADEGISGTSVN